LGLETSGENIGLDANGRQVRSKKAVLSSLKLGSFEFQSVPVMVFDDSKISAARCALGGGVLGSEILPLLNWHFDLAESKLTLTKLDKPLTRDKGVDAIKLYNFGYPHAPIIDYEIGKLSDKLLLDTGSPAYFTLAEPAFSALEQKPEQYLSAQSLGGISAGGLGDRSSVYIKPYKNIKFGHYRHKQINVATRPIAPSLLGFEFFRKHRLLFNYAKEELWIKPLKTSRLNEADVDPMIQFIQDQGVAVIAYLSQEVKTRHPKLELGDVVTELNGQVLPGDMTECEIFDFLFEANAMTGHRFKTQNDRYAL
jgi:hypothetical protein